MPDPQAPAAFEASKLRWEERERGPHAKVLALYRDLLKLRREISGRAVAESPVPGGLVVWRGEHLLLVALEPGLTLPLAGDFEEVWRSEAERYADDPQPPAFEGGSVHFASASALLLRRAG